MISLNTTSSSAGWAGWPLGRLVGGWPPEECFYLEKGVNTELNFIIQIRSCLVQTKFLFGHTKTVFSFFLFTFPVWKDKF